jgi:hypothetical protein
MVAHYRSALYQRVYFHGRTQDPSDKPWKLVVQSGAVDWLGLPVRPELPWEVAKLEAVGFSMW